MERDLRCAALRKLRRVLPVRASPRAAAQNRPLENSSGLQVLTNWREGPECKPVHSSTPFPYLVSRNENWEADKVSPGYRAPPERRRTRSLGPSSIHSGMREWASERVSVETMVRLPVRQRQWSATRRHGWSRSREYQGLLQVLWSFQVAHRGYATARGDT